MNETVREWLAKADGDYRTAARELRATDSPNFDAVCFHAQQCIEKLIKALLIHRGATPPKTHDLVQLQRLLAPLCQGWSCAGEDLRFLTLAAVGYRYPGESADQVDARQAFDICARLREQLLALFDE